MPSAQFAALLDLVQAGNVAILSGAGLSTESGIPDYRGPTGRARSITPITYQTYVGAASARQRYWARSHLGWRQIAAALPNRGHVAVAALERSGLLAGIITQNVDGLHQAAGAEQVVELHGSLGMVICLGCGARSSRDALDARLREANTGWDAPVSTVNPDGDAVIAASDIERFVLVDCERCGGGLKPDVVFFGENVPRARVDYCYSMIDTASALLVLGSSLTVMSGYRFVRHATKLGKPVAIINQGPTRGDALAGLVLDAALGETLSALVMQLNEPAPPDAAPPLDLATQREARTPAPTP